MRVVGLVFIVLSSLVLLSTWLGYPLWLRLRSAGRLTPRRAGPHAWWPSVTIVVVVRNAERNVRQLLQNLIAMAYPADRRMILVVSDASTDFTDAIAASMAHRGVELLRLTRPMGAARALNIARRHVRSDVVVVVDPAARLQPATLAALVSPFSDPTVGVAYGHETGGRADGQAGRESPYRRYEAMLREQETKIFGTVSARRTLYAMRGPLFHAPVSPWLSPDFFLALLAREHGYRALHVDDAECTVVRERSLKRDYARTVWAVGRDVLTLMRKPRLANPIRFGAFSWMLLGHKVGRWLTPWAVLAGLAGLVMLAPTYAWALPAALVVVGLMLVSLVPSVPGHVAATTVAMAHASVRALRAAPAAHRNELSLG